MNKKSNMIAHMRANPVRIVLFLLLIVALGGVLWAVIKIQSSNSDIQTYLKMADAMRASTYRVQAQTRQAIAGRELKFSEMQTDLKDAESVWTEISDDSTMSALIPTQLQTVSAVWQRMRLNADTVIKNKDVVLLVNDVATRVTQITPVVQKEYIAIVNSMLTAGADSRQATQVSEQLLRTERILINIDKLQDGDADIDSAADQLDADIAQFVHVNQALYEGGKGLDVQRINNPEAQKALEKTAHLFQFISISTAKIVKSKDALKSAHLAAAAILNDDAPDLLQELASASKSIADLPSHSRWIERFYVFAASAIVILMVIALIQIRASTRRLRIQERENERNQTAILRLLDELADLADGDLTATATVTEDFTGAIADSINFTIGQLRVLVSRINDTAMRVSSAAQETQSTALQLAKASDHQAQEISGASAAVNEMAVTIDQVSANAAESSAVAERSVSIANKGAEVVQNTIHGMDNIREQIQETSKRIKRLGESSQEIGDIVSLINDIADQTNILALNAAIQASMAGDAGRGFAVVADEVQRLAERSSAATKQIGTLVKTIQADTHEAVASMEQTTAEVVRGARLAQNAGVALEEIENVSSSLADLIQNISNAARQQTSSAGHISNTMKVIQEITTQTSSGTNTTARAIGHLAEMAIDLRDSVQGFKLPEDSANYNPALAGMNMTDSGQRLSKRN